jgi:sulfur transfer protein SufE
VLLDRLQLAAHLSPTRKNGLFAMVQRVRELAQAIEVEATE